MGDGKLNKDFSDQRVWLLSSIVLSGPTNFVEHRKYLFQRYHNLTYYRTLLRRTTIISRFR